MAMKPFNWHCPHCDHKVTINEDLFSSDTHFLSIENSAGRIGLYSKFMVCPNPECRKPTLEASLREWSHSSGSTRIGTEALASWRLVPFGNAKPFPEFVPRAIREDYEEACLVRDLSPKSAATLARRALQGILRDFYKAKPGRLVDEINSLSETMEPELLDAIHAVRKVGNIGAHMEADISVIVDVDPNEAQLLLELVETMIEETYIRRDDRKNRLNRVTALAVAKDQERRSAPSE
jgi:hypothetical protein